MAGGIHSLNLLVVTVFVSFMRYLYIPVICLFKNMFKQIKDKVISLPAFCVVLYLIYSKFANLKNSISKLKSCIY